MDNMSHATDFLDKYSDVDGMQVYGTKNYSYAYINEQYPDIVQYDRSLLRVANIDIEVGSENGFPEPSKSQ